jgi:hypothetical protein
LLDSLHSASLIVDLRVDAMPSDGPEWEASDWELFARLLHVTSSQIIEHTKRLATNRTAYFAEMPEQGDLFLDPDTGVATGRVDQPEKYLMPEELLKLIDASPRRVVSIYQHVRVQKTRARIDGILSVLRRLNAAWHCTSYESGTVAMLFYSRDQNRTRSIHDHFADMRGRHASCRIGFWTNTRARGRAMQT